MDLKDSFQIVQKRPELILLLAFPGLVHFLVLTKYPPLIKSSFIFSIIGALFIPAIYGTYLQDIKGNDSSLWEQFKKHVGTYIIVSITIHVPLILLGIFAMFAGFKPYIPNLILGVLIESITIYVLPFVFITESIYIPISDGILFTVLKSKDNLDLIVFTILSTIIPSLYLFVIFKLFANINIVSQSVAFAVTFISSFLSCLIFVTACIRLKAITKNV